MDTVAGELENPARTGPESTKRPARSGSPAGLGDATPCQPDQRRVFFPSSSSRMTRRVAEPAPSAAARRSAQCRSRPRTSPRRPPRPARSPRTARRTRWPRPPTASARAPSSSPRCTLALGAEKRLAVRSSLISVNCLPSEDSKTRRSTGSPIPSQEALESKLLQHHHGVGPKPEPSSPLLAQSRRPLKHRRLEPPASRAAATTSPRKPAPTIATLAPAVTKNPILPAGRFVASCSSLLFPLLRRRGRGRMPRMEVCRWL